MAARGAADDNTPSPAAAASPGAAAAVYTRRACRADVRGLRHPKEEKTMRQTRREFLKTAAVGAGAAGVLGAPLRAAAQSTKLTVWWNKGYYPEEDAAMQKIVKEFEAKHKAEVDLSFTAQEDLLKKITAALIARRVPDIAFCFYNDWQVVPKFGWDDKLADVSDVIAELKPRYNEKMLVVGHVMNKRAKKRAYYGVPIEAQTMHIHYWRDLLKEVGLEDAPDKIPLKWDAYWAYWKKAQDALRKKDPSKYGKLYGIGMTESTRASDTMYNFEMALLSFNGELLDKDGKIIADQPKNKKAIVEALKWFGDLFTSGYVPPDATNWTDGDNNAGFHSRSIVMTPNPSQSIPAAQFFNKEDPEKRNYFDNMATIEWPDGPDGKKARYLSAVKTIIIPKDSKNQKLAKDFIKFVVEKDRFLEYIKAANGRWFPAFNDVASDPFWTTGHKGPRGEKDLHVPVATTIFLKRDNKVFEHYKHPAISQVYDENLWGKAMARIAIDKWPAERAADEAVERMKAIFAQYK
jgi:multiple sugar transport system substrate-binding protein